MISRVSVSVKAPSLAWTCTTYAPALCTRKVAVPAVGSAFSIEARVRTSARTGVEMEALVAVAAAALTIYDMCKSIDRSMVIGDVRLVRKSGGKSGLYERSDG